jgi:large subunit ribosomal protein L14
MIQQESFLKIVDNSGGRILKCIKVLKGSHEALGNVGDIIVGSIRSLRLIRRVKVGEVHYGVIVRTKKEQIFKDGSHVKFKTNSVVLLKENKQLLGTRVLGPISKNLRKKKFMKLILKTNSFKK